jgi:serpin B
MRSTLGFGISLLEHLDPDGNLVVAPAGAWLALAMAAAGGRGTTAEQMAAALGDGGAAAAGGLLRELVARARPGEVRLDVANALWADRSLALRPAFLALVEREFAGFLRTADFRRDPDAGRRAVNEWVAERTGGRITDLLGPGAIRPETRLVLANAVYLKALWEEAFAVPATAPAPFHAPGGDVSVPFMRRTASFGHARLDGWQAVELPYKGRALAMVVLLPDPGASWPDAATLATLGAGTLPRREVALALPRFRLRSSVELGPALVAMGMEDAFGGGRADFSGLAEERVCIDRAVHEAVVEVDEQGTEAAAATAVVMRVVSFRPDEPVVVEVDRPFLFLVVDRPTGAVLFLGRVEQPG